MVFHCRLHDPRKDRFTAYHLLYATTTCMTYTASPASSIGSLDGFTLTYLSGEILPANSGTLLLWIHSRDLLEWQTCCLLRI